MRQRVSILLLWVSVFLAACTPTQQKAVLVPAAEPQAASQNKVGPVPSAATPGLLPESDVSIADSVLTQAKAAIATLALAGSEPGYREFRTDDPPLVFTCQYSPGAATEEVPLLACKFGAAYNTVAGHALFWQDGASWQAQLYPQASADVVQQRTSYFRALGDNCPIGCGSEFRTLRQSGTELLAVVDLSGVSAHSNQEVHLLKREGQQWRIVWVPTPEAYRFAGHPKVALLSNRSDQFTVSYDDGAVQTWVRQGPTFIQLPVQNGITGQLVVLPDGSQLSTNRLDLPDVSSVGLWIVGIGGSGASGNTPVAQAAGNHVEEIRQEEVTLPIGKASLAVVVRGQPAAANSDAKTNELWLVAVRRQANMQLAYAIRGVITGDESRAKEQILDLGRHWLLPAESE